MIVGGFNIYQIRYELDLLKTKEDKLIFLYEKKKDIRKIIRSFQNLPPVPLKNIAYSSYNSDSISDELVQLLRKTIDKYSANPADHRFISEVILKAKLKEEMQQYEKLDELIDVEIETIKESNRLRRLGNWIISDDPLL